MPDSKEPEIPTNDPGLRPATVEKVFADCVMDVKEVLVRDGIEILASGQSYSVRSHDMHGPLPEIVVRSSGVSFNDKEDLGRETCKLIAIVRLRDELMRFLPGGELLPPTNVDARAVVGLRVGPRTWLAEEGKDFLTACHELPQSGRHRSESGGNQFLDKLRDGGAWRSSRGGLQILQ